MAASTAGNRTMEYLSVYDIVWINTTLAGQALKFDYVPLEEAMAAQYSYGVSTDVPLQAANLLRTLVIKRPFAYGNIRTALVATVAFLNANGYSIRIDDSRLADVVRQVADRRLDPTEAVEQVAESTGVGLRTGVTLRALVSHIFNAHSNAISALADGDQ